MVESDKMAKDDVEVLLRENGPMTKQEIMKALDGIYVIERVGRRLDNDDRFEGDGWTYKLAE